MKKRISILLIVFLLSIAGCGIKPKDGIIEINEPTELIEIEIDTLGEEVPSSKGDGQLPVIFKISSGKDKFKTKGTIRVQGTSTARWPKKNWRLRFFEDEERENKILLKIGDSVPSDKWIAKAEWIDPSMLRNYTSFKLWESMIKSRKTEPIYEVDNGLTKDAEPTGAQGFPRTYPARVSVNGEHYGTSILLLGHEPLNFNIDSENPKHMYMEFDARGGEGTVNSWDKLSIEGIDKWVEGTVPKTDDFTEEHKLAIDKLSKLINGTQENFNVNFNNHLDKNNMIDMLLLMEMIYDWDAIYQDVEMVTYDLEKWYFLPWDKDTTFGMHYDGSGIREDSESRLVIDYEEENPGHKPWFKTYHAFTDDVETRYAQLRDEGVFTVENIEKITDQVTRLMTEDIMEAEFNRWAPEGRPSVEEATQEQLLTWFEQRLKMLDDHFNY